MNTHAAERPTLPNPDLPTPSLLSPGLLSPGLQSLDDRLRPYLASGMLPSVAAAVASHGQVVAAGAVGTRRAGHDIPVTINDRYHLGSDTKAMTALLAGMMVDDGRLRWNSTIAQLFPERAPDMSPTMQAITLDQLLSHTSGIRGDNEPGPISEAFLKLLVEATAHDGDMDVLRTWIVAQWTRRPTAAPPGEGFSYSNLGYLIAGAMIERAAGITWEELLVQRIMRPLALETGGIGPQSSVGQVDAPLSHDIRQGKPTPVLAGPNADLPLLIGPAGLAHMSVVDFARWAAWQAGAGKRGPALVKPETMARLQTEVVKMPSRPDHDHDGLTASDLAYGYGWGHGTFPWSGRLLMHGGSNGKNAAVVMIDPAQDLAIAVVANVGMDTASKDLTRIARGLYETFRSPRRRSCTRRQCVSRKPTTPTLRHTARICSVLSTIQPNRPGKCAISCRRRSRSALVMRRSRSIETTYHE